MIYRLSIYSASMGHEGYEYFPSRRAAERARAEAVREGYHPDYVEIEALPTPKTKKEIIALLTRWASHNDNG